MRQIIMSRSEIQTVVKALGDRFTERFRNDAVPPVFIGVMKGALPFMMDLMREIRCPILTDFIQVSSYMGTESTGVIKLKKDISVPIGGRKVILVEDIVDSGYTLVWLKDYLTKTYAPESVECCVLLDKRCKRKIACDPEYVGKEIGDYFIVGYGLDYDEFYRNEPDIFVPDPEEIRRINRLNQNS